jgi:hypothetical protein
MMDQTEQQQIKTGVTLDKLQLGVQLLLVQQQLQCTVRLLLLATGCSKFSCWQCSNSSS